MTDLDPTDEELAQMEARCEFANAGPWTVRITSPYVNDIMGRDAEGSFTIGRYVRPSDADFIAHARTDLPRVLAALRSARSASTNDEVSR